MDHVSKEVSEQPQWVDATVDILARLDRLEDEVIYLKIDVEYLEEKNQ